MTLFLFIDRILSPDNQHNNTREQQPSTVRPNQPDRSLCLGSCKSSAKPHPLGDIRRITSRGNVVAS
jgi:hypothetical protein